MRMTDNMTDKRKFGGLWVCIPALACAAALAGSAFAATDWRNAPKETPAAPAPAPAPSGQQGGGAQRGTVNEQHIIIPGGGGTMSARPDGTTVITPQAGNVSESTANEQNIVVPGGGTAAEGAPPDVNVTGGNVSDSTANEQNITLPGGGTAAEGAPPDVNVTGGNVSESTANEQNIVVPGGGTGPEGAPPDVNVTEGSVSDSTANEQNITLPGGGTGPEGTPPDVNAQRGDVTEDTANKQTIVLPEGGVTPGEQAGQQPPPSSQSPDTQAGSAPTRVHLWELMPRTEIPVEEDREEAGPPPQPDQPKQPESPAEPQADEQQPQGPPAVLKDSSKQAVNPPPQAKTEQAKAAQAKAPEGQAGQAAAEPKAQPGRQPAANPPKAEPKAEPKPEPKAEPKQTQKSDKPKPGEPLRIPPEAVKTGNLDFLEGCWQGTRPEYFSKRIVKECFCFNKGGRSGKRRIFDGGRKCIGATAANLSKKGVLSVTSEGGRCDDGANWGRAEMICRGEGQHTPCSWVFRDAGGGRQSYEIPFVRVQACGR